MIVRGKAINFRAQYITIEGRPVTIQVICNSKTFPQKLCETLAAFVIRSSQTDLSVENLSRRTVR